MMQTLRELDALIKLLDDPDINIYRDVEHRILSFGIQAREHLKSASFEVTDYTSRQRLEYLIAKINLDYVKVELKKWREENQDDLLAGMLLIAEFRYPELNREKVRNQVDLIRKDAWLELNNNLTALEQVKILNHVFFDIHGFHENKKDFYAPENSFINDLLLFKQGNPISLSALYSIIAQKLDIPIYGVNLPEHFILAYVNTPSPQNATLDDVLFYINAFNKGIVFTQNEINQFLKKIKLKPQDSFYLPCSNNVILQRMINNLIFSYHQSNQEDKALELDELLSILRKP